MNDPEPFKTFYAAINDDFFLCPHCSAVVLDPDDHQQWHWLDNSLMVPDRERGW